MTAPAVKTIRRRFAVGKHFATLTLPMVAGQPVAVNVEWDGPRPPRLRPRDLLEYQRKRNAILQGLAEELGARIAVAEPAGADGWQITEIGAHGV